MAARSLRAAADFLLYHALPRECEVVGTAVLKSTMERVSREQAEQCGSDEDQAMCDELELEESLLESDDDEHDKVDDIKGKQPVRDVQRSEPGLSTAQSQVSNKRKMPDNGTEVESTAKRAKVSLHQEQVQPLTNARVETLAEPGPSSPPRYNDEQIEPQAQGHGEFANAELHAPEGDGEVIDIIIDDSIGVTNEQDAANNAQDVNVEESSGIFDRIFNEAQGPWNETSRERGSVVDQDVTKAVERAQESTNASASEVVRDGNAHE